MIDGFDPGALLARSYFLPRGPRVCLRLARIRDLAGLADLYRRQGLASDEVEIARLVRFDPRRRVVICATALLGSAETVVGVGAVDLGDDSRLAPEPSVLLVDEALTEGLADLLTDALIGRVQALARGRAA